MKLPTFSLINAPPDTLILHAGEYPFHFAKVLKYPSNHQLAQDKPGLIQERINSYNIVIRLAGSLEGRIYMSVEGPAKLQKLVKDMADWFTKSVIEKQVTKFMKYRLSEGTL